MVEKVGEKRLADLKEYSPELWGLWVVYAEEFHEILASEMPLVFLRCWLEKRHPELKDLF